MVVEPSADDVIGSPLLETTILLLLQGAPGVNGTRGPVGDPGQRGRAGFPVSNLRSH